MGSLEEMKSLLLIPLVLFLACEDKQEDTTPPTVSISSHSSGQSVNEIITTVSKLIQRLLVLRLIGY